MFCGYEPSANPNSKRVQTQRLTVTNSLDDRQANHGRNELKHLRLERATQSRYAISNRPELF